MKEQVEEGRQAPGGGVVVGSGTDHQPTQAQSPDFPSASSSQPALRFTKAFNHLADRQGHP